MKQILKTTGYITLILTFSITMGFMFKNGEPYNLSWYFIALPFLMWSALPLAAIFLIWKQAKDTIYTHALLLFTACFISLGGIWILYDAFLLNLDPQSGLVFLILPVLQLIVVAVAFALLAVLNRFLCKPDPEG